MLVVFVKYDNQSLQRGLMKSQITSTEAVRNFSELLNNIRYRGDQYTVTRGGKPAAAIVPVEQSVNRCVLGNLQEIFRSLPRLDPDDDTFASDVMFAVNAQPAAPTSLKWD